MKKHPIFLILILFSVFASSCKYDFILPEVVVPVTDVSFAEDVAPIFSNNDKCTSCHKPGGTSPDLTAANAYAQIMANYVNTASPAESVIYALPAPSTSTHNWKKYTVGEAALILKWIEEGAENN